MSKLKVKDGIEFTITKFNVGIVEDIKDETGIDLDELIKEPKKLSEMLFASPRKIVEILWVICEKPEGKEITPREFARLFDREVLDEACNRILEEIMLFYPRTSVGRVIRENLPQMIQEMDKKLTADAEKKVKEVLLNIATNSPVSLEG